MSNVLLKMLGIQHVAQEAGEAKDEAVRVQTKASTDLTALKARIAGSLNGLWSVHDEADVPDST